MRHFRTFAFSISLLLGAVSCGKQSKFVYYNEKQELGQSMTVKIKEVLGASGVDILWLVDNSGSMGPYQADIMTNADLFMQEFSKKGLDWKLGLLSMTAGERGHLGLEAGDDFTFADPDPTKRFVAGMRKLQSNGGGGEATFDPLIDALRRYPTFMRPQRPLAVILLTDAPDQSRLDYAGFKPQFDAILGKDREYFAYGVIGPTDFGCPATDTAWVYAGSRTEEFFKNASNSKAYPICSKDYGKLLADMGQEISEVVSRPVIYLKHRPKPSTLKVFYRGVALKAGPREDGGLWYYDFKRSSVVFYSLGFTSDFEESVRIEYDRDDGTPDGTWSE